jgi:hypothetical protein
MPSEITNVRMKRLVLFRHILMRSVQAKLAQMTVCGYFAHVVEMPKPHT